MINKNITGLAEALALQAKERFKITDENIESENNAETNTAEIETTEKIKRTENRKENRKDKVPGKMQKTFYIAYSIDKALKRCAIEEECDQTSIITKALEAYLTQRRFL